MTLTAKTVSKVKQLSIFSCVKYCLLSLVPAVIMAAGGSATSAAESVAAAGRWCKESMIPYKLSNKRIIQVSANFGDLEDRVSIEAKTVMLHKSITSITVSQEAVVKSVSAIFPGMDPKAYIQALYKYEKDSYVLNLRAVISLTK